jgi:hypothetical protein
LNGELFSQRDVPRGGKRTYGKVTGQSLAVSWPRLSAVTTV